MTPGSQSERATVLRALASMPVPRETPAQIRLRRLLETRRERDTPESVARSAAARAGKQASQEVMGSDSWQRVVPK